MSPVTNPFVLTIRSSSYNVGVTRSTTRHNRFHRPREPVPVPDTPQPTPAELDLLRVLWQRGPSTVRDMHAAVERDVGYTTVLKLLQIMTEKGLVTRDASARSHIYTAAVSEDDTQRRLVADLRLEVGVTDVLRRHPA